MDLQLKNGLDNMTFTLNKRQIQKLIKWQAEHKCKFRDSESGIRLVGAIAGVDTFKFTPTSLGNVIRVTCACGDTIDLTEW